MNGKKANTINRYKYFHHVDHQKFNKVLKKDAMGITYHHTIIYSD